MKAIPDDAWVDSDSESCGQSPQCPLTGIVPLQAADLEALKSARTVRRHEKGEYLFRQGEPCTGLYDLRSGLVAERKSDDEGTRILLRMVYGGRTVGSGALFGSGVHSTTVQALDTSEVCHIPRRALEPLLQRHPRIALTLMAQIATDLDLVEESLLERSMLPVKERLVRLLVQMSGRYGERNADGSISIKLPVSRGNLAELIGVRPETLARVFRELEPFHFRARRNREVLIPEAWTEPGALPERVS